MRNNRLKLLSIPIYCLVVALWSEIQCMENQTKETEQNLTRRNQIVTAGNNTQEDPVEVRRDTEHPMTEARARLMDAKIGVDWWRNNSMNAGAAMAFVSFYTSSNYYGYDIFSSLLIMAFMGIATEETLYWMSGCGRRYVEALSFYNQTRGLDNFDDKEFLRRVQISRLDHSLTGMLKK